MAGLSLIRYLGYSGDPLVSGGAGTAIHVCGVGVRRLVTERSAAKEQTWMYDCLGISVLAVHPQNECFAICERSSALVVRLCSMEDGSSLAVLDNVGQVDVSCMAFTADGRSLVTVGALPEFTFHVWDWRKGETIVSGDAPAELKTVEAVEFHPHFSDQFTLHGGGMLFVCNVVTGSSGPELEFLQVLPPDDDTLFVSHTWTGKGQLFCTTSAGSLWQVDSSTCTIVGDPVTICKEDTVCRVLAAQRHLICYQTDGAVAWIGDETLVEGYRIKIALQKESSVVSVCLSEQTLFVGTSDGSVYDVEIRQAMPSGSFRDEEEPTALTVSDVDALTGEIQHDSHHRVSRLVASHVGSVNALCGIPAVGDVASGGQDGSLIIWDPLNGAARQFQRVGCAVTALAAHPEAPLLGVGDAHGTLKVVEVAASHLRCMLNERLGTRPIAGAAWNTPGSLLVVTLQEAMDVWLVSHESGTLAVMGFMRVPSSRPLLPTPAWVGVHALALGERGGCVFTLDDVPTTHISDELQILVAVRALRPPGGVSALAAFNGRVVVSGARDRATRVFQVAGAGWTSVVDVEGTAAVPEYGEAVALFADHASRVGVLAAYAGAGSGSLVLVSGAADGAVFCRAGEGLIGAVGRRVFSVWDEGCIAACVTPLGEARSPDQTLVLASGRRGAIAVLSREVLPQVQHDASGAPSIATGLLDHLKEVTELVERTVLEQRAAADMEMANALNAARKNETRERVGAFKVELNVLLAANASTPDFKRLPRGDIVVDAALRERIVAEGNVRVANTQAQILRDNTVKELRAARIKTLAWDSMQVHGTELVAFQALHSVLNYPIRKQTEAELRTLERVRMARRIELHVDELGGGADAHVEFRMAVSAANDIERAEMVAGGGGGDGEDKGKEGLPSVGGEEPLDALMYPRTEANTRERKTAQLILLQDFVRAVKAKFNRDFDLFLSRKQQALGRIDEKVARLKEIAAERHAPDNHHTLMLGASEQPGKVLRVEEDEVAAEKWVSPQELAEREAEARRLAAQSEGGGRVDRALDSMMGRSLNGQAVKGTLDQELDLPAHLCLKEDEEYSEEQLREVRAWEDEKKKLDAEKDAYLKTLDAEAKKLKADIQEEAARFDTSLHELAHTRLCTDYRVNGLELYQTKLVQDIVQEEDDIARKDALKSAVVDLTARREVAARAVVECKEEEEDTQRRIEGRRADAAGVDKVFRRELVDCAADKEQGQLLLHAFRRRTPIDDFPTGLEAESIVKATCLLAEAQRHDTLVAEAQGQLEAMHIDLKRLSWVHAQLDRSIRELEKALAALDVRMQRAGSDLDLVLVLKQGQVEVEQAAVATDYTDAQMLARDLLLANNSAIVARGADKVAVLQERLEFRKGIHQLQWENARVALEEEELLQCSKDLQLLRVTKNLQSVIKGFDVGQAAAESAAIEKMMGYHSILHSQYITAKVKAVEQQRVQTRSMIRENAELEEDIFALESAVVERQRLCELQGGGNQGLRQTRKAASALSKVTTHRKLMDLAKAQTREIELMQFELVRLRARTFPSFSQLSKRGES